MFLKKGMLERVNSRLALYVLLVCCLFALFSKQEEKNMSATHDRRLKVISLLIHKLHFLFKIGIEETLGARRVLADP